MARKLSPGTHTIRIKKPGGGTRMQRVNVLKSGKFKFIKNVKGAARSKAKKGRATPRGKTRGTSPGRRKPMARRKTSMVNRVANLLLLLLAFQRPIQLMLGGQKNVPRLIEEATGGFSTGAFNPRLAAQFYGPVGAAFILFEVKKMAMKKFRF